MTFSSDKCERESLQRAPLIKKLQVVRLLELSSLEEMGLKFQKFQVVIHADSLAEHLVRSVKFAITTIP